MISYQKNNYKFIYILLILQPYLSLAQNNIDSTVQELSEEIMSPYCPGRTLSSCPSDDARKLRIQIKTQLEQGYSKDAIKRQLIGMFGKDIKGTPDNNSFGIIAWTLPFIVITICCFLLINYIRKDNKKKNTDLNIQSNPISNIENKLYEKLKG